MSSRHCSEAWPGSVNRPTTSSRRTPALRTTAISRDQSAPSGEKGPVQAHSGSYAVCVRTCDGSFFPVSYSGAGSRRGQPRGRLPGPMPERRRGPLFVPVRRHIEEAAAPTGEPYANLPNAGKFEKTLRPHLLLPAQGAELGGGARRRRGALRSREARHSGDAGEVGRNGSANHRSEGQTLDDAKGKPIAPNGSVVAGPGAPTAPDHRNGHPRGHGDRAGSRRNGADTKLSAAAATVSREGSGIAGGDARERQELQREAGTNGGGRPAPTGSSGGCG